MYVYARRIQLVCAWPGGLAVFSLIRPGGFGYGGTSECGAGRAGAAAAGAGHDAGRGWAAGQLQSTGGAPAGAAWAAASATAFRLGARAGTAEAGGPGGDQPGPA